MPDQYISPSASLGLIGIGLLGSALAERLLHAGYTLRGYDCKAEQNERLTELGGQPCCGPDEVFRECDVVLLSLPSSHVVQDLVGLAIDAARSCQTVIDTTTGHPRQMMAIGQSLRAGGINYLEANVAGSSSQLRAGSAVLLLGGEVEVLGKVEPILANLSGNRFHVGPVGAASRFKLVHNLVLGLHRAVLAEGLNLAEQMGLPPAQTLEILQQTPAASSIMSTKGARMVGGDFTPEARLSQHLKDVRLILSEARRLETKVPLSSVHAQLLEQAEQLGLGELDNSAVIELYRHRETPEA